jgi:hypothetical protein
MRQVAECKYNEEKILEEIHKYVMSTYQGHYVGKGDIQTFDVWDTLGISEEVCIGTAIKYLMRFGKKDGKNLKDLLKSIHYTILLIHYSGVMDETHNEPKQQVKTNNGSGGRQPAKRSRPKTR